MTRYKVDPTASGNTSAKLRALEEIGVNVGDVLDDGELESLEKQGVVRKERTGGSIRLKASEGGDRETARIVQDIAQLLEVLPPDQRVSFAQEIASVLSGGQIEEKTRDQGTYYGTMPGELQRTLETIFPGPEVHQRQEPKRPSRLVGDGNTWLDRFASGRSIKQKESQSLDEWLDSLPTFDEGWLDRWLLGEEESDDNE